MAPKVRPVEERFAEKYTPVPESGCWIWDTNISRDGYGKFWHEGKTKRAHRVSYEIHRGPIPKGMCVCHRCDTPRCVNPDHLFLGTHAENVADRDAKNRHRTNPAQGEDCPKAKLTEDDVLTIRGSDTPNYILADRYGVSRPNISNIKRNIIWRHI